MPGLKIRPCNQRWWVVTVTQPLATFAFALGAWLAYRSFPTEFDWYYLVVSALQSPRDNPDGYLWFALGIGLSGLLLLPLRDHLGNALAPFTPRGARVVRSLLSVGIAGMVLVAVFTHRPSFYPRLHENLAVASYATLVIALLTTTLMFMRYPDATLLASGRRHWVFLLLGAFIFGPLFAAGLTQLTVYLLPYEQLAGTDPTGQIPPYLSLAFWEWLLSLLLYASAWLLAWLAAPPAAASMEAASSC